jgi:hypothetical protein
VTLSRVDGVRAEATLDGTVPLQQLHLIFAGARWWIAGKTWEDAMGSIWHEQMQVKRMGLLAPAAVHPLLADRVAKREFASIERVREALRVALTEYLKDHPEIAAYYRDRNR